MKLLYELEDSVVGIIVGILILMYAGLVSFKLPYFEFAFPAAIIIFLVMNLLDVVYFIKDMHENLKLSLISFVINIVDILINLGFLSLLFRVQIPFISEKINPLINEQTMPLIACYLIFVNFIWIYWYHKK